MLTAEQRYCQARQKARMLSRRALREMMEGKRCSTGECMMDMERRFLIDEINRSFEAGRQYALKSASGEQK